MKASEYRELKNLALYYAKLGNEEAAQVYYLEIGGKFPEIVQRDPDLREGVKAAVGARSAGGRGSEVTASDDGDVQSVGPIRQEEMPKR